MEIGIEVLSKYQSIRSNAYWTRVHFDTIFSGEALDSDSYAKHLEDCNNNPTVGLLARRKYITGRMLAYPQNAKRNVEYMNKLPNISTLKKSFKEKLNKLYPKTLQAREYIINHDRVKLNSVEPARKYNIFNKLAILLKKFI